MKIAVCIKQVPATQKVQVDPETGVLIRDGIETKMNPYDLYAMETALQIKQRTGAGIAVITMGPPAAEAVLQEAFALGADEAVLMTDRQFAGADVLATSYTLSQGIRALGAVDCIICGKQTTDGDTAQVGPAIAEYLGIPHVSWVKELVSADTRSITLQQDLMESVALTTMSYPCLITVEKGIFQPNLPSYKLKTASRTKQITVITLADCPDTDPQRYGLAGSPTQVERIFSPTSDTVARRLTDDSATNAHEVVAELRRRRLVEGGQ